MNRDDVIKTIDELASDLVSNPDGWENPTLDRFLDAMQAWLEDSKREENEKPSWELMINMLRAGRNYE